MYKINNWCCFLIIFVLFINELKAQKETFTYDGSFSTSLSTAGDVKYDYYKEGREKIFHGRFNYNLRLSKNIGRINNISGVNIYMVIKMVHGLIRLGLQIIKKQATGM